MALEWVRKSRLNPVQRLLRTLWPGSRYFWYSLQLNNTCRLKSLKLCRLIHPFSKNSAGSMQQKSRGTSWQFSKSSRDGILAPLGKGQRLREIMSARPLELRRQWRALWPNLPTNYLISPGRLELPDSVCACELLPPEIIQPHAERRFRIYSYNNALGWVKNAIYSLIFMTWQDSLNMKQKLCRFLTKSEG